MQNLLDHVSIGHPVTRAGVSFFPVYVHGGQIPVTTGPDAGIIISERPDAQVPTLVAHNPTPNHVLLCEGETVTGGRQSRTLNVSVLIPAGQTIDIPVSCVEQGRWSGGREFGRGKTYVSRRVRREKVRGVAESVKYGTKYSDQSGVWNVVDYELNRLHRTSNTGSFIAAEQVLDEDSTVAEALAALIKLGPLPGQCGFVIAHGSRIVAADVFATPELLGAQWEALVRTALLDAPEAIHGTPSATKALRFLRTFSATAGEVVPGAGLGNEHHITSRRIVGQALVWDGVLVHTSAFAVAA